MTCLDGRLALIFVIAQAPEGMGLPPDHEGVSRAGE